MINKIREELIKEALNSPSLLSDIAGLEKYISESYNARTIMEILQNADDANADEIYFELNNLDLIVCNNGNEFSNNDFESICRSANSNKIRGKSIGYRGIGFKSVLNFSNLVSIISKDFKFMFSKKMTKDIINTKNDVPLIRIPHPITSNELIEKYSEKIQKYNVAFIFEELKIDNIEQEIENFEKKSLLFLKNVRKIKMITPNKTRIINLKKERLNDFVNYVILTENTDIEEWLIYDKNDISIAFLIKQGNIEKLDKDSSLFYSFLPTEEKTGMGIIINGDISTDPSRKKIIFDDITNKTINNIAKVISEICIDSLFNEKYLNYNSVDIFNTILPFEDPSLIFLKTKNSNNLLVEEIKKEILKKEENFIIKPKWLNNKDYSYLINEMNIKAIRPEYETLNNGIQYLKYLEAKEIELETVIQFLKTKNLSIIGTAEIFALLIRNYNLKKIKNIEILKEINIIFAKDDKVSSVNNLSNSIEIKQELIELILEKNISIGELNNFIKNVLQIKINNQFENHSYNNKEKLEINKISYTEIEDKSKFIKLYKKWRRAEEYIDDYFKALGYSVKDVSKQNLGYDLEISNEFEIKYIEVKMIDYFGKPFTMTNNEWIVANGYNEKYSIALVKIANSFIEVIFVENPTKFLEFQRKSLQWVFECSEYSNQKIVKIEIE